MGFDGLRCITNTDHKHGPCRAWFDEEEVYRYALSFEFAGNSFSTSWLTAILLNPSTANAFLLDPTATKICTVAIRAGYRGLTIVNCFALRSTDPHALLHAPDPVGPDNDAVIAQALHIASWMPRTVGHVDAFAGWGNHGKIMNRDKIVKRILARSGRDVYTYRRNLNGTPMHPLYVSYETKWQKWELTNS